MTSTDEERPLQDEDDGAWVDAELLRELLDEGATVLDVHAQRATGKGDNYLSVLYRTHVQYRTAESEEVRELNLIVKGLPPGEFIQTFIEETGVFSREIAMYDDMLPRLYDFADAQLGKGSFKRFSARSYKTSRPNTLILDDLKSQGFEMASRRDRLDLAHSKLVVQNLARMHALSVAHDEKYPGSLAQYPNTMFVEKTAERQNQFMAPMFKTATEEVSKWEGFSSIANKMEALRDTTVRKVLDICKIENCPRTVLVHGDCWVNNMMFKYSETGQPIDFRFLDFQISHEASPALDLNYFLFSSPRTDVRERHLENLVQEYCDEFERSAKALGYTGAPFTFEGMRREMDRTGLFGFMAAVSLLPILLADPKDVPDLENFTEETVEKGEIELFDNVYHTPVFREAFSSVLPYFDERGVLD